MSKDYISPEHAIRNIMLREDWKQNLTPEQRSEYIRKYGANTSRWPNPQSNVSQEQQAQQAFSPDSILDNITNFFKDTGAAKTLTGKTEQELANQILDQIKTSTRRDNLSTTSNPGDISVQSSPNTTSQQSAPEVQVGYGDGKVDPRLASAAGIGPKLAGSEPPAKPSSETPSSTSTSSSVPASAVRPKPAMPDKPRVPNIKLASKLSDLNYTGMGTAARNEYLQKSADAAWAKPTRENLSLRQRAHRQEYGPNR